ncbi:MAG: hypothetical protein II304_07475 [Bacteroidales bacterium]|nr:hypothetical protein [Bacteroidales bacterium]
MENYGKFRVTTFSAFIGNNIIAERFFDNFEDAKNACIGYSNLCRAYINYNGRKRYELIGYSINGNYFNK